MCLTSRPCRASSARPAATCQGVGKMRLWLRTTARCQTAMSRTTGPRSASPRCLSANIDGHRPRAALETVVHVALVGDGLPDDASFQGRLHQLVELRADEPEIGIRDPVARIREHVLEDL